MRIFAFAPFALTLAAMMFVASIQPATAANPVRYEFDKTHSSIMFFVNHLGFSLSTGRFLDFDGFYSFDPDAPEASEVDVTIKTGSLAMQDDRWDAHMKNEDFFNVEKFPDMHFKSTEVVKTGDKTGVLKGDLTLLGVTKPVELNVTLVGTGKHPMAPRLVSGFSATGTLKRSDFGMTYGLPNVGDEVEIRIEIEGFKEVSDTMTAQGEK
ncbi:MAG: polyisoprenoid-binding protein [Alphaproteobacteria bacterium]|nr:MAG: polyisoprenoid-binding protein [Alphaproteobacteria bacterium]